MAKAMCCSCKAQSQTEVLSDGCASFVFAKGSYLVVWLDKVHGCDELSCIWCLRACSCINAMCSKSSEHSLVLGPILHTPEQNQLQKRFNRSFVYIPTAVTALWKPLSKVHTPICLYTKTLLQASTAGIVIHSTCYMYTSLFFQLRITHCIANKLVFCKA